MKTVKLYYEDAYIKEFEATVVSCLEVADRFDIVLDQTAFFPEEGGQSSDNGHIADVEVFDVREIDGIIHHYAKSPVNVGESVLCRILFEERIDKMRCHTAEHIISGLFHSIYGIENTGFHLGHEDVTFDTSKPVTREQLNNVERLANEAVMRNLKVTALFPSEEELRGMQYRSKLELTDDVRIVVIGDVDSCACCAPHVAFTGEIGYIKFVDAVKHKGGSRVRMLAGMRAYSYVSRITAEASLVSVLLSAPVTDIFGEVKKVTDGKAAAEYALSSMGCRMAKLLAENTKSCNGNLVVHLPLPDMEALRAYVNIAAERVSGILVALIGCGENYKYVLHYNSPDFAETVKNANTALLGKGGGKTPMAQGSFSATLMDIEKYFM